MNKSISKIRAHFESWGYDTSHVSDNEIEAGVVAGGQRLRDCALTTKECVDGIGRMLAATHHEIQK